MFKYLREPVYLVSFHFIQIFVSRSSLFKGYFYLKVSQNVCWKNVHILKFVFDNDGNFLFEIEAINSLRGERNDCFAILFVAGDSI